MLESSVRITSPRPCGITSALAASGRTSLTGNRALVRTLSTAATKVVSRYSQTTVPNRRSRVELPCARALATMTNTSTGAMPFRAPTNKVPNSSSQEAWGQAMPSSAPMSRPKAMRRIRLMPLYQSAIPFAILDR